MLNISILKLFKKGLTPLLCALTCINVLGINVSASSSFFVPLGDPVYLDPNNPMLTDVSINIEQYGAISSGLKLEGTSSMTYKNFVTDSILGVDMPNGGVNGYYDIVISFRTPYLIPKGVYDIRLDCYTPTNMGAFRSINLSCYDASWNNVLSSNSIPGYVSVKTESNEFYVTFNDVVISDDFVNIGLTGSVYYQFDGNYEGFMVVPGSFEFAEVSQTDVILQSRPSGSISNVPSSGIIDITNKEQELLSTDISSDLSEMNVDLNPNAAAVTWDFVNAAIQVNDKVFAMFLSILAVGVIGLILNR